ncbi:MAG: transketolase, partial [bacterium]
MLEWNTAAYAARAKAFGWTALEIDGHDMRAIDEAYTQAGAATDVPVLILARTVKGKGAAAVEDKDNWHGKALPKDEAEAAIRSLGGVRTITVSVRKPEAGAPAAKPHAGALSLPSYKIGESVATRRAYGDALKALGAARPDVVALDGEVSNSTYSEDFAKAFPTRFFEMYIAEQQMVAAAVGLQARGYAPFASTFAAFLTRAYDFIRMAAVSRANVRLCGSHAGVSIGQDGPSQMGLEDLAMLRAVGGSTVLYPSDANQTAQLVAAMADRSGIVYMRTTREKTPVLYPPDQRFIIGGSAVLRRSERDQATIVAAGITVHEALRAAEQLAAEGLAIRVIDAYSVKPIDRQILQQAARETGRIVCAEDHWPEGGLGEAVLAALAGTVPFPHVTVLGVRGMPGSGTPEELLDAAGISARHIAGAVRSLIAKAGPAPVAR